MEALAEFDVTPRGIELHHARPTLGVDEYAKFSPRMVTLRAPAPEPALAAGTAPGR